MNWITGFGHRVIVTGAFVLSFTLTPQQMANAQSPQQRSRLPRNALFAEAGGKGGLYTICYERTITDHLGFGVGFSSWNFSWFGVNENITIIPIYASVYPVGTRHRLYVDVGVDLLPGSSGEAPAIWVAGIGYNYRGSGGYFKAGPSVFFGRNGEILPWANLSFGFSF